MRLGWLFVVLGVLFAALGSLAITTTGWWFGVLAFWPSVSFFLVAGAYLRFGPGLFGKRADGSLPWIRVLLLLPYFLFTWGIWHLLRLGPEPSHAVVAPGLYLGRLPRSGELPADVRLVVDLTAEFPRSPAVADGCDYINLPALDALVPSIDDCERLVRATAAHPGPVYVHCAQGHGRSALVAGAVLMLRGLASGPEDAEAQLRRARPGVRLSSSQRAMLRALHPRLAARPPAR